MRKLANKVKLGFGIAAIGLAAIAGFNSYFIPDTVTTQITGTDTKRYSTGDKYLINTQATTFENTDAWYRFKFDSSDMQGQAKGLVGKTVEIEKYGWRIPMLSMYENIVEINEVNN